MSAARKLRRSAGYLSAVAWFAARHVIAPGTVTEVAVLHDDGCSMFKGRPCSCEPDVASMAEHRRDQARRN